MQLSEFTFLFLTLCIPFLGYIVSSTNPKKGFSILFISVIAVNALIKPSNFSLLGLFFLILYLYRFKKQERNYYILPSLVSFLFATFDLIGEALFINLLPTLLVSSVFSSMMIGHWFLVDPTI